MAKEKWIDCEKYIITKFDSDNIDFEMEISGEGGAAGHILAANATKELVRDVLAVLAKTWPRDKIQFQVGEFDRLTKIRVKPGT